MSCPKCGTERRADERACARCGLVVSLWDGFRVEIPEHPALDAAWATLRDRWDDSAAHDAFVRLAADADGLDIAAARYRQALRERADDASSKRSLTQLAALVEHLHRERAKLDDSTLRAARRARLFFLIVSVGIFLAAGWLLRAYLMVR